jgi:2-methylisocitrate lyase-like PEP mutase family enzyme
MRFRSLHDGPGAFVIPNPRDVGSAQILAGLGFQALATSSAASACALGLKDHEPTRDEAMAHAHMIVEATGLSVSADLGKGFAVCGALSKPFNFMAGIKGKSFSVNELTAVGVKRISLATSLYRAATTGFLDAARQVRDTGQFAFLDRCVTTSELNQLMRT